jgi:DNA-binding NarL/FixJ family response regulator
VVTRRVLIADDSAPMRRALRHLLQARNPELEIHEAVDGLEAIEKAASLKPDLIVLDLAMPRLNGAETAAVLKKSLPKTPVVLFTLYADQISASLVSTIGVQAVLSKDDGIMTLLEIADALFKPSKSASKSAGAN